MKETLDEQSRIGLITPYNSHNPFWSESDAWIALCFQGGYFHGAWKNL